LRCNRGDENHCTAFSLLPEIVDCELSCTDWVCDVDFKRFVGVGFDCIGAVFEMPEV
jgi:hypothetical protein